MFIKRKHSHFISCFSLGISLAQPILAQAVTAPADVEPLIQQLASERFEERQHAMDALWKLGKNVLPVLEKHLDADDPELALRARILLRNIQSGILPDTPKEIAELVEKYNKSKDIQTKLGAFEKLRDLEAFKQMLYMLRWETDPAIRKQMHQHMINISLLAARKALEEDGVDEAISLLREAVNQGAGTRPLAHLLYYTGKLDAELASQAALPPKQQSREWQLQLLLTKGDRKASRDLAKTMDNQKALALLNLLDGNAQDILSLMAARESKLLPPGVADHLINYCLGKPNLNTEKFVKELTQKSIDANTDGVAVCGLRGLFLSGHPDEGAKVLAQRSPLECFQHYNSSDQSQLALAALGIPDPYVDKNAYLEWVKNITTALINDEEGESEMHMNREKELLLTVHFLHSRGEHELAKATLKPMLDHFIKDGSDQWYMYLSSLAQDGMPEYAIELALERGHEDNAFERTLDCLCNDSPSRSLVWNTLGLRHPKDPRQQFTEMVMLLGVWRDKHAEIAKLEDSLAKEAIQKGAAASTDMLSALSTLALIRNDIQNAYKFSKRLIQLQDKPDLNSPQSAQHRLLAEVLMDWPEIVKLFTHAPKTLKSSPASMAKYAIALRKVGQDKKADEWMQRSITFTLGDKREILNIANMLQMSGYNDEAVDLLEQLLLHEEIKPAGLYPILAQLNSANHYMKAGDWEIACAMFAVQAMALECVPIDFHLPPALLLQTGFNVSFSNGMLALERGRVNEGKALLHRAHAMMVGNGYLADYFFPILRKSGLKAEYEKWFEQSWQRLQVEVKRYPMSHNTHNSIAWLGSRAVRKVNESRAHAETAVKIRPRQGAYIDTLAEVYFSMGDRDRAVKTSERAVSYMVDGSMSFSSYNIESLINTYWDLSTQHKRFINEPLPTPEVRPMKR